MLFRNDDVSVDTDLNRFKEFCAVFDKYGLCQAHGIVINGYTNSNYKAGTLPNGAAIAVPYEGHRDIAEMTHEEIVGLSEGKHIDQNSGLVELLSERYWDEKVMHGRYHYAYDTGDRLLVDIRATRQYFQSHDWDINYTDQFVFPFNRVPESMDFSSSNFVASLYGKSVLGYGGQGVHFESALANVVINPSESYRYHHHRFYPESVFDHYDLSLEKLDACFSRSFDTEAVKIPGFTSGDLRACLKKYGVQDWFTYNYEHCYTIVKEMLSFVSNMHPRDKNSFLVYEFGGGVGLNLFRLRELGFKNMICADNDLGALRVAAELADDGIITELSDFTSLDASCKLSVKPDVAICLNAAMLDANFSYGRFFDGINSNMGRAGLLLIDSVDPSVEDKPEYKTRIGAKELIALAARRAWQPIFFKQDGGVQVHRDFFIFKKL